MQPTIRYFANTLGSISEYPSQSQDLIRICFNPGRGSAQRRKDVMHTHLSNMHLYRTYADSVQTSYLTAMNEPFVTLREKLHEQIETIAGDLRAVVVPAGEVSEVERAPGLVREFQRRLRALREVLDRASEAAQAAGNTIEQ